MMFPEDFFPFVDFFYNPWAGHAEKSQSAKRRERQALEKFDALRDKMERALMGNKVRLIELGCKPESPSVFGMLPAVSVEQILDFLQDKPKEEAKDQPPLVVAKRAKAAKAKAPPPTSPTGNDDAMENDTTLMDMMNALYVPGKTFVVPLLEPNCHLTGPCWRDFSRAVRQHDGWDVKRVEATPEEKKKFRETRRGKVYFIRAIYTVPGGPAKKKKRARKVTKQEDAKKKAKVNASLAHVAGGGELANKRKNCCSSNL
jgi:hypothetical protein